MSSRSKKGETSKFEGYSSEASSEGSHLDGPNGKRKASLDKGSDEYKKRRERNNEAVKKSREKAKEKTEATVSKVNELTAENVELNRKVDILNKEFELLKEMFNAHNNFAHSDEMLNQIAGLQRIEPPPHMTDDN